MAIASPHRTGPCTPLSDRARGEACPKRSGSPRILDLTKAIHELTLAHSGKPDGVNAIQIRERAGLTPGEIIAVEVSRLVAGLPCAVSETGFEPARAVKPTRPST